MDVEKVADIYTKIIESEKMANDSYEEKVQQMDAKIKAKEMAKDGHK